MEGADKLITIKNETIHNIPTLHVVKAENDHTKQLPTVFFLHGYTSAKEHNLAIAYLLAEKGFRVILPDALHHGEREGDVRGKDRDVLFWNIVLQSIKEISLIKDNLQQRELIDNERIGVAGTSMGAITMYGTLSQYSWIHSAVSFMGTAYFQSFANAQIKMIEDSGHTLEEKMKQAMLSQLKAVDLSQNLEALNERPLLIWHGEQDQVVPFDYSKALYAQLYDQYDQTDRIQFIQEPNTSHKVTRHATLQGVDWFCTHLLNEKVKASVW